MNAKKPIPASRLVKKPELIKELSGHYVMLRDRSGNNSYVNMLKALNLMAENGWEAMSVTHNSHGLMLALMKRVSSGNGTPTLPAVSESQSIPSPSPSPTPTPTPLPTATPVPTTETEKES